MLQTSLIHPIHTFLRAICAKRLYEKEGSEREKGKSAVLTPRRASKRKVEFKSSVQ